MDRLVIISDNPQKLEKKLEGAEIPFSVINSSGSKIEDWKNALNSGGDYIFYYDEDAETAVNFIPELWRGRSVMPIVMGKQSGGFSGWLMKMLASYFCQVFVEDACPTFVFVERSRLEEALSYNKEENAHADAVLACGAAYRGEDVTYIDCPGDDRKASGEAGSFLARIIKAYPAYQHAGENMMKAYADKPAEEIDRGRKTAFDKLLGLVNHEIVSYVFFGVLTTIVSIGTFAVFNKLLGSEMLLGEQNYLLANVISWVFAVLFAFVTNKVWVFNSRTWKASVVAKELSSFITARLVSLLIDMALMFLFVDIIHTGDLVAKLIVQVVVVILNYVFSKLFIFKNRKK